MEAEGEIEFVGGEEFDVGAAHGAEAWGGDFDVVDAGHEEGERVEAVGVGFALRGGVGVALDGANFGARDGGSGFIGDLAGDGAAEVLREGGGNENGE